MLTIIVEGTNKISHARTHGCLHLIDLAGSERVGKSGAEGQQLLEAQHINKSLRQGGAFAAALRVALRVGEGRRRRRAFKLELLRPQAWGPAEVHLLSSSHPAHPAALPPANAVALPLPPGVPCPAAPWAT